MYAVIPVTIDFDNHQYTGKSTMLQMRGHFILSNIEALACGTPVITYDTGGSPEVVFPGTGSVVYCGDQQELSEAINSIDFNEKECCKISSKFTTDIMGNRYYTELYE